MNTQYMSKPVTFWQFGNVLIHYSTTPFFLTNISNPFNLQGKIQMAHPTTLYPVFKELTFSSKHAQVTTLYFKHLSLWVLHSSLCNCYLCTLCLVCLLDYSSFRGNICVLLGETAWWAAVHVVAKSRTQLSGFTLTFHFHALEKEMGTHSSVLAWRIPGTGEPGGLPSMGSRRVGHSWSDLAAAAAAWF